MSNIKIKNLDCTPKRISPGSKSVNITWDETQQEAAYPIQYTLSVEDGADLAFSNGSNTISWKRIAATSPTKKAVTIINNNDTLTGNLANLKLKAKDGNGMIAFSNFNNLEY